MDGDAQLSAISSEVFRYSQACARSRKSSGSAVAFSSYRQVLVDRQTSESQEADQQKHATKHTHTHTHTHTAATSTVAISSSSNARCR
jgi:hypothetical protein